MYVSTIAPGFRVSAFRVGWYGGAQARRVWVSGRVRGVLRDHSELLVATRTVRAGWQGSVTVGTGGWPEGAYLLRLDAEGGHQCYVPLVVRSVSAAGRTLIMHAPATWQAYNAWGGYSLYRGRDTSYAHRSLVVSFDRPYDGNGAETFMVYERAAVVLAERLGIPLAYTTGVDVHRSPSVLRGATTAVALGHDEYWTPEQRRHVTAARDAGTNLVFLGANTCFRRIRLEAGPQGGASRAVVCYKSDYHADPYLVEHPAMATTDFRERPGADPESSLTGVIYDGYPVSAPIGWRARTTGSSPARVRPGAIRSSISSAWSTTGSIRTSPAPARWRSWPTRRCPAGGGRRTPIPPTTRSAAAPASSRPGRCDGSRRSWPVPARAGATTAWMPGPGRSSPVPRRTCCAGSPRDPRRPPARSRARTWPPSTTPDPHQRPRSARLGPGISTGRPDSSRATSTRPWSRLAPPRAVAPVVLRRQGKADYMSVPVGAGSLTASPAVP